MIRIKGFLNNRLAKVLMGQRRCGKSFILRQIIAALVDAGASPRSIFYLDKEGRRSYYQVCYLLSGEKVIEREFQSLERIADNHPKSVVSLDDVALGQRNGIEHQLLWNML